MQKKDFPIVVFALCVVVSMWFVMDTVRTVHRDMYAKIVASPLL